MAIKPLFDKVVIKAIETDEKTASGIVLPGAAKENIVKRTASFIIFIPYSRFPEIT